MNEPTRVPQTSPPSEERAEKPRRRGVAALVRDLAVAGTAIVLIGVFLVQPFRVEGASMEPLLADGERILVDKLAYRVGEPSRFDVVVLRTETGATLVKRVIALPGERVETRGGRLLVDGRLLREPYVEAGRATDEDRAALVLAPGQYWVLGDNRRVSVDSRRLGPVSRSELRGRAVVRYWPPGKLGRLPRAAAVP